MQSLRATSAPYARKVALVVGSDSTHDQTQLRNCASDALKVANKLKGAGFRLLGKDSNSLILRKPTKGDLLQAVERLEEEVDQHTVAVFYYAGHGITAENKTYMLVPDLDEPASTCNKWTLERCGCDLEHVLLAMEKCQAGLVLWDACRSASCPTPKGSIQTDRTKGVRSNIQLIYACTAGKTASDGPRTAGSQFAMCIIDCLFKGERGDACPVGKAVGVMGQQLADRTSYMQAIDASWVDPDRFRFKLEDNIPRFSEGACETPSTPAAALKSWLQKLWCSTDRTLGPAMSKTSAASEASTTHGSVSKMRQQQELKLRTAASTDGSNSDEEKHCLAKLEALPRVAEGTGKQCRIAGKRQTRQTPPRGTALLREMALADSHNKETTDKHTKQEVYHTVTVRISRKVEHIEQFPACVDGLVRSFKYYILVS